MRIRVINGPNINMLGKREPDVYGSRTYPELCQLLEAEALNLGFTAEILQSSFEGQLIDWILDMDAYDALIINPAAYSHYSLAVMDALLCVHKPVIEVHLTNIHKREDFRNHSVTAKGVVGIIAGFGFDSYMMALNQLKKRN